LDLHNLEKNVQGVEVYKAMHLGLKNCGYSYSIWMGTLDTTEREKDPEIMISKDMKVF